MVLTAPNWTYMDPLAKMHQIFNIPGGGVAILSELGLRPHSLLYTIVVGTAFPLYEEKEVSDRHLCSCPVRVIKLHMFLIAIHVLIPLHSKDNIVAEQVINHIISRQASMLYAAQNVFQPKHLISCTGVTGR